MTKFKWNANDIRNDFLTIEKQMELHKNGDNILLYCDLCRLKSLLKKYPNLFARFCKNVSYPNCQIKYEKIFCKEFEHLLNIIIDNKANFKKLFGQISSMNFDINSKVHLNDIAINNKIVNHLRKFFKTYDSKLLLYFEKLYNNHNINIENFIYDECAAECVNISSLNKQYINIYSANILPSIIHEVAHAYEFRKEKKLGSWIYDINLYSEVFAIFITLIGDEYLQNTDYYLSGITDKVDFLQTVHILANDINYELTHEMNNFSLFDFIYAYDANIALALVEQYQYNPKEAKRNIDYYLNNSAVNFSNKLLKSIDINLNRLYSGDYYFEYYQKTKKLVK